MTIPRPMIMGYKEYCDHDGISDLIMSVSSGSCYLCRTDKSRTRYEINAAKDSNNSYYVDSSPATKESFIDFVRDNYPDDFLFFLYHPEIFNGRYSEE